MCRSSHRHLLPADLGANKGGCLVISEIGSRLGSGECGGHAMGGWLEDSLRLVGQVGGIYGESGLDVSQAGGGGAGGNVRRASLARGGVLYVSPRPKV